MRTPLEQQAHQTIDERVARSRQPHVPAPRRRTAVANRLRRFADALDN